MKIELLNDGKILKDETEINVADITSELLETIMEKGLNGDVELIDNSGDEQKGNPIVELFKSLNESFKVDSDFRKQIEDLELKRKEIDKKISLIETEDKEIVNFIDSDE